MQHAGPHRSSVTGYAEFDQVLEQTKRCGYSTNVAEYYIGYNSVSVAVLNPEDRPGALLAVRARI
jgi:DNA-binding IclR family transcriptional regulator